MVQCVDKRLNPDKICASVNHYDTVIMGQCVLEVFDHLIKVTTVAGFLQ